MRALALWFESEEVPYTTVGGAKVKVPTPEDLIIMKAVAQRPKDMGDIEALLRVHENLDLNRIRYWAGEFAAALETPGILDDLERMLTQRPRR